MALTPSNMLPLGTLAPDFSLPDTVSGQTLDLQDIAGAKATVIMFSCNHCPYVLHLNDEVVRIANEYEMQGIGFVAISSNDITGVPEDAPDRMKALATEVGYSFPYLYDETQAVAKAYDAACTPDFYIFDENLHLVYRGRLDNSRPNSGIPLSGKDLRAALDAIISGKTISVAQFPSMGCNIKWK
jgi:peroxiredoxin